MGDVVGTLWKHALFAIGLWFVLFVMYALGASRESQGLCALAAAFDTAVTFLFAQAVSSPRKCPFCKVRLAKDAIHCARCFERYA